MGILAAAGCGGDDEAEGTDTTTTETSTVEAGSALQGSVGPGFEISLTGGDGAPIGTLAAGS